MYTFDIFIVSYFYFPDLYLLVPFYADDKDNGNGEEYQLIGINAWCNRSTWITCDSYDLTINKKKTNVVLQSAPESCTIIRKSLRMVKYFFNSVLRPFQDFFSSYETGQSVGGRKRMIPEKKNTWHIRKQKLACLKCCQRGARTHTRHRGQILICLIHSSTREAVSPEQCVLMTRTAKASVAFGRICANVISEMKQRSIPS